MFPDSRVVHSENRIPVRIYRAAVSDKMLVALFVAIALAVLVLLCDVLAPKKANGALAYPSNLWKGLIAEATSDGRDGMTAVACCVRNRLDRGMNTGLCGLKRKNLDAFVAREGKDRERMAKAIVQAVFEDGSKDVTNGATHFESVHYKTPSWAKGAQVTARVGEHVFYKGVR